MKSGGADIALLDILMPGMTGTSLAAALRSAGFEGHIVFLTSSNDFAAESYAVGALSYLLKPVDRAALRAVLDRAAAPAHADTASFAVRQGKLMRQIPFQSFLYAEVIGHTLEFHLLGGEVARVYASLSDYEPLLLREPRCARCHKSFIVNMDFVERVEGKTLTMCTGRQISITRSFADFGERYFKWIFKEKRGES